MNWFHRTKNCGILRAQLQQADDELQKVKKDYEKLIRKCELDDEAVRRMLASYSDELSKVKVLLAEQKRICQSLLQDKAKLQSELIDHLKLLRLRDERLGLFRRDLADSEFEVDQMRVALHCNSVYSLKLEADKQAAEVVIQHVCSELDRVVSMAAWALDRDASAPLVSLGRADLGSFAPSPSKLSRCLSSRGRSPSGLSNAVAGCSRKAAAAAAVAPSQLPALAPQMVIDGCETQAESSGDRGDGEGKTGHSSENCTPWIVGADGFDGLPNSIGEGEYSGGGEGVTCRTGLTGRSSKGSDPGPDITSFLGMEGDYVKDIQGRGVEQLSQSGTANHCSQAGVSSAANPLVSAGLASLYDFVACLPKHLWSLRQQLHGLIMDPEAAAAAVAVAMASTKTDTAASRLGDTTAHGGAHAAPLGARGGNKTCGSSDPAACPLSVPPPPLTAADALLKLYGMAAAKPRRSGNEPMAEYDGAVGGGLQDWGHRRKAATAAADGELIARLVMKSRERRGGGAPQVPGGITTSGAAGGGTSPPASVPRTPHQRPPILDSLSEALQGLAPGHSAGSSAGGGGTVVSGIRHAVVVQGRCMAGAASSPASLSLSLLSSPTRCSTARVPLSPVTSPTAASPPYSFGNAESSAGTGLTVTSTRGGNMDTGLVGAPGPSATSAQGSPSLPPTVLSSAEKGELWKEQHEQPPQQQQHHAEREGRQHAQELDSELISLRLSNKALQRQVAEVQRQNDLLQLRQLGGSGGDGLCHGDWCSQYPQPDLPQPHQRFLASQNSRAFPWSTRTVAGQQQQKAAAAIAAAAAATASPYNSPLSAPYYYGSLPPGQQPTMGVATGADEPPPLLSKSDRGGFGAGTVIGRTGAMTLAGALRVGGTALYPSATHNPHYRSGATVPGLPHSATAPKEEAQAMKASTANYTLHPPPPPLAVAAALAPSVVGPATAPPESSLAAKAPPPPGIDPALWELDLLVACSKGAGGLME